MKKEDKQENPLNKLQSMFKPRGPGPQKEGTPQKTNFTIWYFVLAFILLLVLQHYFFSQKIETISYSKFKQEIVAGNIAKLTIGPDTINGTFKAKENTVAQNFVTVRVEDPDLIKQLDKQKIDYSGRYENTWFSSALT